MPEKPSENNQSEQPKPRRKVPLKLPPDAPPSYILETFPKRKPSDKQAKSRK